MIRGRYKIWLPERLRKVALGPDIVLENRITDVGEIEFLFNIVRNASLVAGGGNYFFGLCNQIPNETDTLADISTEPTVAFGYARQSITRDSIGWPVQEVINGHNLVRTKVMTFVASGGDFSVAFSRFFMTDQTSGLSGLLYGYSGALTVPLLLLDGESFTAQYELYLD